LSVLLVSRDVDRLDIVKILWCNDPIRLHLAGDIGRMLCDSTHATITTVVGSQPRGSVSDTREEPLNGAGRIFTRRLEEEGEASACPPRRACPVNIRRRYHMQWVPTGYILLGGFANISFTTSKIHCEHHVSSEDRRGRNASCI
jgi:hypothetical protein